MYALFSYPLGALGDKIGLKNVLLGGLVVFAVVYFGMAVNHSAIVFFLLFLLYGVYAAATDGVSTAWISNMSDKKETATAIGTFKAFQSICTMIASSLAGLIWYEYGAAPVFIIASIITVLVFFYLMIAFRNKK
jgi:MFS family permease